MLRFLLFSLMMMTSCFIGCDFNNDTKDKYDYLLEDNVEKPTTYFIGYKGKNQGFSMRIKETLFPAKEFLLISLDGNDYRISLTQTGELVLETEDSSMMILLNLSTFYANIQYADRYCFLQSKDGYIYKIHVTMRLRREKALHEYESYGIYVTKYKENLDAYSSDLDSFTYKEMITEKRDAYKSIQLSPKDAEEVFSYTVTSKDEKEIAIRDLLAGDIYERSTLFAKLEEQEYAWWLMPIGGVTHYSKDTGWPQKELLYKGDYVLIYPSMIDNSDHEIKRFFAWAREPIE